MTPTPATLLEALERSAALTGEKGLRFVDAGEHELSLSWREVLARARAAAGALVRAGVRPGRRVALILPTGPAFVAAFLGCQYAGALPVPLYPPLRLGRLQEYYARTAAMLRAVKASLLVSDRRVSRLLGHVLKIYHPPLGEITDDRLGAPPPAHFPPPPGPDALAMVQFSSGTTSDPKPVALTHRQILANVRAMLEIVAPDNATYPHEGVCWLPLYHDMGLIGCVLSAMCKTASLTLIPPDAFLARPALWLRAISRHRGTVSPAPNFAYALCTQRIKDEEMEGCDLSSWRLALNGAESASAATMRAFHARFARWGLRGEALTPVYGLAEATLAVTFSDAERGFRARRFLRHQLGHGEAVLGDGVELVSVGRPLRDARVAVRDSSLADLPAGRVGRIWVRAPWIMHGYLDRADAPIREGWLDTGDLGFLLDGELYVTGRARDVIVLRGQNHSPQDIEQALDAVGGVRTGCTAAVGDIGPEGDRLVLFVEAREARASLASACRQAVLAACGVAPSEVVVVAPGTLPRTSSGKIRHHETLQQWKDGTLAPPEAMTSWRLASEMVQSAIARWRSR